MSKRDKKEKSPESDFFFCFSSDQNVHNENENYKLYSNNARYKRQNLGTIRTLCLTVKRIGAARDSTGKLLVLATLHHNENAERNCENEKNDTENNG